MTVVFLFWGTLFSGLCTNMGVFCTLNNEICQMQLETHCVVIKDKSQQVQLIFFLCFVIIPSEITVHYNIKNI